MQSVVMIAYAFPPEGNAGAYRPLRFARYLPKMGWHATIISLETDRYERYDPELLTLVPSTTEVIRVRNRDVWQTVQAWRSRRIHERLSPLSVGSVAKLRPPPRATVRSLLREAVRKAEAWCYHPDTAMGWIRPTVDAAVKACTRRRSKVIWATGAPWSAFVAAQRASQQTEVPYVLDFRSSWTLVPNEFEARRPAWARRRDQHTLFRLLKAAQAVIFAYDAEAECYWRAYPGALDVSRMHIIPNGYDGAVEPFAVSPADRCTILYAGTLSSYRYDTLLHALQGLKKADPAQAKQVRFLFVGEGAAELADKAEALGLSDIVETAGPTSHAEINRLQQRAHALLMLERKATIKGYELLAGAKLFGYLKAGRPIIGVLPPGEAKKILHRVGVSTVADVDSPAEIAAVIRQILEAWSGGTLSSLIPDPAACQAYSAERQTAALIRALEGVPPATPFVPGSVEIPASLRGEIGGRQVTDA